VGYLFTELAVGGEVEAIAYNYNASLLDFIWG
jgi:hypothetical protein